MVCAAREAYAFYQRAKDFNNATMKEIVGIVAGAMHFLHSPI